MELESTMGNFTPGISQDVLRAAAEEEKREQVDAAKIIDIEDISEEFSLFSWGWSDPLKVTSNGVEERRRFKIKSVGIAELMETYQAKMPAPPASRKMIKRDTPEAREYGYKHDTLVYEINEADATYLEMKRQHDNEAGQEIVLRGIAYDLKYDGKIVMKGKDTRSPNEIIDREGTLKAFRRFGLTAEHFAILVKNIRELTAEAQAKETGE